MRRRCAGLVLLGMIAGIVPACPSAEAQVAVDGAAGSAGNLTAFYRLQERFTTKAPKDAPGMIGQNQVAFRETASTDDPKDKERIIQAIYSERPAAVSPVDDRVVTDSVKHYKSVTISPDPWKGRTDRRPLDDLAIWYRTVAGEAPAVLVLTPDRQLREEEYKFAINYNFVTDLSFILPDLPKRIGETWAVERAGATALVNDDVFEGSLTAKFAEVRAHPKIEGMQLAIIDVTGRIGTGFDTNKRDTAIRARIQFAFTPEKSDESTIEGSGFIEKVSLSQVSTLNIAGQIVKKQFKRQFVLERKVPGTDAAIAIPDPPPAMTEANSWLTYTDPKKRFHIRHPQGFQPFFPADEPGAVDLRRTYAVENQADIVRLQFVDKLTVKPEATFKQLIDAWRSKGIEVIPGLAAKLPETEWGGLSVSHLEAALTTPETQERASARRYFDGYVIQFPRNVSLFVSATTSQNEPESFRKQVLLMLKTVKLDAPK